MPTAHVNNGGVWTPSKSIWVKDAGVWKEVQDGWIKDAGVWKRFHALGTLYNLTVGHDIGTFGYENNDFATYGVMSPPTWGGKAIYSFVWRGNDNNKLEFALFGVADWTALKIGSGAWIPRTSFATPQAGMWQLAGQPNPFGTVDGVVVPVRIR